jgi:hypothetical protein
VQQQPVTGLGRAAEINLGRRTGSRIYWKELAGG